MFLRKEVTIMSWVKKQFNKFFKMDPDADYVEYEDEHQHQAEDNDALSQNRRANTQYEEQKPFARASIRPHSLIVSLPPQPIDAFLGRSASTSSTAFSLLSQK